MSLRANPEGEPVRQSGGAPFEMERPPAAPEPAPRTTEADVFALLAKRYGTRSGNGPKWALIPHVRNGAGWGGSTGYGGLRTCDAIAVGLWPSTGLGLHGHEIKVSRSDWLRELKDPTKADAFRSFCDHWWVVAPAGVVRADELPAGWGLLEAKGRRLLVAVWAPALTPKKPPRGLVAALARAACRGGVLGGEERVLNVA